jgi:hypothetical protein
MSLQEDDDPIAYLVIPGNAINEKLKAALDKLRIAHPDWFAEGRYQTSMWENHFPMKVEAADFIADLINQTL